MDLITFDTPVGPMALAEEESALTRLWLPGQGYPRLAERKTELLAEGKRQLLEYLTGLRRDFSLPLNPDVYKRQTLFFSATMPPEVQGLVDSLLHNPVKVAVNPVSSPVEIIDQKLYFVDRGNKTKLLASLIREGDVKNALVFTRTKHGANKVAGDLVKAGITAAAIHGNKSQTARQQALADFKAGQMCIRDSHHGDAEVRPLHQGHAQGHPQDAE